MQTNPAVEQNKTLNGLWVRGISTRGYKNNNDGLFGIASKAGLIQWIVQNKEQNVKLMFNVCDNNLYNST